MKTIVIYVVQLMFLLTPANSQAFEYEVDMPNSGSSKYETIRIRIDSCDTIFKVSKNDFQDFKNKMHSNPSLAKDMIKQAMKHKDSGCR